MSLEKVLTLVFPSFRDLLSSNTEDTLRPFNQTPVAHLHENSSENLRRPPANKRRALAHYAPLDTVLGLDPTTRRTVDAVCTRLNMIPAETIHGVECPGVHNAPTSERLLFVLAPESNCLKLSCEHLVDSGLIEKYGSIENCIDSYLATHAPIIGSCGSTATISRSWRSTRIPLLR